MYSMYIRMYVGGCSTLLQMRLKFVLIDSVLTTRAYPNMANSVKVYYMRMFLQSLPTFCARFPQHFHRVYKFFLQFLFFEMSAGFSAHL